MKILLVNKFFYPKGGSETVFFQERDFFINNGHKVIDFSMEHPENLPSEYSAYFVLNVDYKNGSKAGKVTNLFERLAIAAEFIHNKGAIKRLSTLIEKVKPDIAHLHNIYHQITPSIIPVLKNAGAKVVLTLHDYKLICPSYLMINNDAICNKCQGKHFWHATSNKCQDGSYFKSLLLSIEAYWHKWAKSYEKVDLILSPSRFLADLLAKYRIEAEKIKVLHNGIDINEYECSEKDEGYAVYFGRISAEKGLETLLQSHQLLSNRMPLKIIGTGPLMGELKEKYPGVEFTGYIKGKELRELIKVAAFVVVPSVCYENCSMSILEAMAYGKPVIGSKIGGIPAQIEDGKTGFLFEMGNAEELAEKINILANNEDLKKKMGKAARKKLERKYSLEAHCSKLMKVYEGLLEKN